MTTTRVFLLALTTWITCFAIANQAQAAGRPPPPPPPPPTPPTIATLDLDSPTTYPTFITSIRNKVADRTQQCTIPKVSKPTAAQRYAYINLQASATQTVTLVMDTADLYVLGYRDKNGAGADRFFYFKDAESVASRFFPGATGANRIKLTYNGNYIDLEKNGGSRSANPLGIFNLENSIVNIYGKDVNVKSQSKFFLQAIQMVSEAARFKYISDKIPQDKFQSVTVDDKMVALENGWSALSKYVYDSKTSPTTATKCQLATSPAQLGPWSFKTVEEIKQVLGLLKSN